MATTMTGEEFSRRLEEVYATTPGLRLMRAIRQMTLRYGDSRERGRGQRAEWQLKALHRLVWAIYRTDPGA